MLKYKRDNYYPIKFNIRIIWTNYSVGIFQFKALKYYKSLIEKIQMSSNTCKDQTTKMEHDENILDISSYRAPKDVNLIQPKSKEIDMRELEMTQGITAYNPSAVLEEKDLGEHLEVAYTPGMLFIQQFGRRNSSSVMIDSNQTIAAIECVAIEVNPSTMINESTSMLGEDRDLSIGDLRQQIDDLEMDQLSLESEIYILGSDSLALTQNCPYPHWLTIFDRGNTSPHVGSEEDQRLLDTMEDCPNYRHLSRKQLTLCMIDRLIEMRREKLETTLLCVRRKQERLNELEMSLGLRMIRIE